MISIRMPMTVLKVKLLLKVAADHTVSIYSAKTAKRSLV